MATSAERGLTVTTEIEALATELRVYIAEERKERERRQGLIDERYVADIQRLVTLEGLVRSWCKRCEERDRGFDLALASLEEKSNQQQIRLNQADLWRARLGGYVAGVATIGAVLGSILTIVLGRLIDAWARGGGSPPMVNP